MQTKKRAKSVKFGKKKEIKESIAEVKEIKAIEPTGEEITTADEIKQEIAAKLASKAEESEENEKIEQESESDEDKKENETEEQKEPAPASSLENKEEEKEPEEVNLTSEAPEEKQEEKEDESESKPSEFGSFTKDYEEPKRKNNNLAFFLIVLLTTFIVGLAIIGGFYYFSNKSTIFTAPTPTPSPTAIPSPTETPLDLSGTSIEVLNGSGISGMAAKIKSQLEDIGFTVDRTGNADNSNYTKTVISAKESVDKAFINALIKALEKDYVVEPVTEELSETSRVDVSVTIGSETTE